jgi:hypothetical protein
MRERERERERERGGLLLYYGAINKDKKIK